MNKGLLIIALLITCCFTAYAETIDLVRITTDVPEQKGQYQVLKLSVDDQNIIDGLIHETYATKSNNLLAKVTFAAKDLPMGLLMETRKHPINGQQLEVVKILGRNFSINDGGSLVIRFLRDGISNTYSSIELELAYQGSKWALFTPKGGVVQNLFIASNANVFGIVGIKDIRIVP